MINKEGKVDKSWGYELIFSSNDLYCGKLLVFTKKNAKFSMHFHKTKDESWFVNSGRFLLSWIDTKDATLYTKELKEGETWRNLPLLPHQLQCITDSGSITEVSTADDPEDNYRIIKGDSQLKPLEEK